MLTIMYFFWDGFSPVAQAVFCAGMYRPGSVDRGSSYYASQDQASTRFASEESASSYENRACDQQL